MLYIVLFLHQTTTLQKWDQNAKCCISYYSYIKPQLYFHKLIKIYVVYRTIPTSNHNCKQHKYSIFLLYIVLFLHQTTTVNHMTFRMIMLYIVLFLHQTTTCYLFAWFFSSCISYYSYIKPQLPIDGYSWWCRCISYYSYIKPQPNFVCSCFSWVVYRTIPTSNHNDTNDEPYKA